MIRIVLLVLLCSNIYAQDSLDLSKMTRSQLRQYRLLIENKAKVELQKERAYYSYTLKVLEERHKFHIDSMSKLRALERMNYNKQLKLLEEKNKLTKDSLKRINNVLIQEHKKSVKLARQRTLYLYGIITLVIVIILAGIYLTKKLT